MKKRKLETKITTIVDGNGRAMAESIIDTQFRELLEDISELITKAVRRNPENPLAELGIDKESMMECAKILKSLYESFDAVSPGQKIAKRSAISRLKKTLNRLDVCYLASAANLSWRANSKTTTLKKRLDTLLSNGVRGDKWNDKESATPSSKNRKHVPKANTKKLRENAKLLRGRSLKEKVLNVVKDRLESCADRFDLGENAVRITNNIQSTLRQAINVAVDSIRANPVITGKELEAIVRREMSTAFGASRSFTKVSSRAIVSSSLNLSIVETVERLVKNGTLTKEMFFLNKPAFLYKAVMDLRTSDICRTLNGLVIPLEDKARLVRYLPPQHANCRSILVPNLRP